MNSAMSRSVAACLMLTVCSALGCRTQSGGDWWPNGTAVAEAQRMVDAERAPDWLIDHARRVDQLMADSHVVAAAQGVMGEPDAVFVLVAYETDELVERPHLSPTEFRDSPTLRSLEGGRPAVTVIARHDDTLVVASNAQPGAFSLSYTGGPIEGIMDEYMRLHQAEQGLCVAKLVLGDEPGAYDEWADEGTSLLDVLFDQQNPLVPLATTTKPMAVMWSYTRTGEQTWTEIGLAFELRGHGWYMPGMRRTGALSKHAIAHGIRMEAAARLYELALFRAVGSNQARAALGVQRAYDERARLESQNRGGK